MTPSSLAAGAELWRGIRIHARPISLLLPPLLIGLGVALVATAETSFILRLVKYPGQLANAIGTFVAILWLPHTGASAVLDLVRNRIWDRHRLSTAAPLPLLGARLAGSAFTAGWTFALAAGVAFADALRTAQPLPELTLYWIGLALAGLLGALTAHTTSLGIAARSSVPRGMGLAALATGALPAALVVIATTLAITTDPIPEATWWRIPVTASHLVLALAAALTAITAIGARNVTARSLGESIHPAALPIAMLALVGLGAGIGAPYDAASLEAIAITLAAHISTTQALLLIVLAIPFVTPTDPARLAAWRSAPRTRWRDTPRLLPSALLAFTAAAAVAYASAALPEPDFLGLTVSQICMHAETVACAWIARAGEYSLGTTLAVHALSTGTVAARDLGIVFALRHAPRNPIPDGAIVLILIATHLLAGTLLETLGTDPAAIALRAAIGGTHIHAPPVEPHWIPIAAPLPIALVAWLAAIRGSSPRSPPKAK